MKTVNKILTDVNKGIDIVIKVNRRPVGGQQNAVLNQQRSSIDITNKINPEWSESLSGTRSWNVRCNGLYVVNSESLKLLEQAFLKNQQVEVFLTIDGAEYYGDALLTDFPLNAVFNAGLKYNLTLLGTGALKVVGES